MNCQLFHLYLFKKSKIIKPYFLEEFMKKLSTLAAAALLLSSCDSPTNSQEASGKFEEATGNAMHIISQANISDRSSCEDLVIDTTSEVIDSLKFFKNLNTKASSSETLDEEQLTILKDIAQEEKDRLTSIQSIYRDGACPIYKTLNVKGMLSEQISDASKRFHTRSLNIIKKQEIDFTDEEIEILLLSLWESLVEERDIFIDQVISNDPNKDRTQPINSIKTEELKETIKELPNSVGERLSNTLQQLQSSIRDVVNMPAMYDQCLSLTTESQSRVWDILDQLRSDLVFAKNYFQAKKRIDKAQTSLSKSYSFINQGCQIAPGATTASKIKEAFAQAKKILTSK